MNPIEDTRTTLEAETLLREILTQRHLPGATYRVQFSPDFTFQDASDLVPYLHDLGITDLYASPLFRPRQGSTHGYDVVDYSQLNPALGDEADFERLIEQLEAHRMGLILDIVPNHMGIGMDNHWWMDVLEHGPSSPYAQYFDINWLPTKRALENKVLLPILEDHYGRVLEDGKFQLVYDGQKFGLRYGEMVLPVTVSACIIILQCCLEHLPADGDVAMELESLLRAVRYLPPLVDFMPAQVQARQREEKVILRRLAALHVASPQVQVALQSTLARINGQAEVGGNADTPYDLLDRVIAQQSYYPAFWRVAADEINYRRFFDINDMAALNVQIPEVFDAVHDYAFRLLGRGVVTGLRIDHPDGLWNPTTYFRQLQEGYVNARLRHALEDAGLPSTVSMDISSRLAQADHMKASWPLYVVAEKILSEIEPLPENWAVYGTTGYDFVIAVNDIFVNRDHVHAFDELYGRFIGQQMDYRELIYQSKKQIMEFSLASEISARSQQLARIVEHNRYFRGFTLNSLRFALSELMACMAIYRTYITGPGDISERDRHYLEEAVAEAKRRNPRVPWSTFDFVRDLLLLENLTQFEEAQRPDVIEFVMRFQQITGPVMAKSVEDTAFYIYNRLASLNEVGGNPEQFGIGLEDFHGHNIWHLQHWPHTMLGASTHDTKRSEDVRARLNVLSEMPQQWEAAIWRWSEMNAAGKTVVQDQTWPDRNTEYLLYQSLLGAWPNELQSLDDRDGLAAFEARIVNYMQKAVKEAKVHTSWVLPDEAYDAALKGFIRHLFAHREFLADFQGLQQYVAYLGHFNSLAQTLLRLTAPGLPDVYQGTELWDFSLVDPDNRRPVDYEQRRALLAELRQRAQDSRLELAQELLRTMPDGRIKLYVLSQTLNFRRQQRDLFEEGGYTPLYAQGSRAGHVCAFQRAWQDQACMVVVPVLVAGLTQHQQRPPLGGDIWQDTRIYPPEGQHTAYRSLFTGEVVPVAADGALPLAAVLADFPVALLVPAETAQA